jgi:hypothetical protein
VSLAHTHRVNKMYSHERSVEERKPVPEISAIGLVKKRHNSEAVVLNDKLRRQVNALNDKHQTERNDDPMTRNGAPPHDMTLYREREEHDALDQKQKKLRHRLKEQHATEMEAAIKEHGSAP